VSNMNGRTRKKFYELLIQRDGNQCNFCKIPATEKQLVVDHIDNNNSNNELDNLQLLCRRCNYIKDSRGPVDTCERPRETEIQINRTKEPKFRKYVYDELGKKNGIKPKILLNSGAELCEISPTTAKRYLDKLCSKEGLCKRMYGVISFDEEHPLFKGEIPSYDGMCTNTKTGDDVPNEKLSQ
jgi:hypothetical protein